MSTVLPDRLKAGDILRSRTGVLVRVRTTSKREKDTDEPLYRLAYIKSGITSYTLWSRDKLQEEDCTLVTDKEQK